MTGEDAIRKPRPYVCQVSYSVYNKIRAGTQEEIIYPTIGHLPREQLTFKDLPGNIANRLKHAQVNDELVIECYPEELKRMIGPLRDSASKDLVVAITKIEDDDERHHRTIKFKLNSFSES